MEVRHASPGWFGPDSTANLLLMWLITAGPTREYLDSVRFLSNGSSGTMGYAIAREAAQRGHPVCLLSGPVALPCPSGVERIQVESAEEMLAAGQGLLSARDCEVLLGVAAVSDSRPRHRIEGKPAKGDMPDHIELVPNPDVLASLTAMGRARVVVGFALESMLEDQGGFAGALERARAKLQRKGLHAIVLNALDAMEQAEARCWWVEPGSESRDLGSGDKAELAVGIVDRLEMSLRA